MANRIGNWVVRGGELVAITTEDSLYSDRVLGRFVPRDPGIDSHGPSGVPSLFVFSPANGVRLGPTCLKFISEHLSGLCQGANSE